MLDDAIKVFNYLHGALPGEPVGGTVEGHDTGSQATHSTGGNRSSAGVVGAAAARRQVATTGAPPPPHKLTHQPPISSGQLF